MRFFSKRTPSRIPRTFDFTSPMRFWGHDYSISKFHKGGKKLEVSGWWEGIKVGDFLLFSNDDAIARYRVTKIEYYRDPSDMWFATMVFDTKGWEG